MGATAKFASKFNSQVETMLKFVILGLVGFALAHALPAPSAAVDGGSALSSPADSEFGIVQHPVLGGHLLLLRAPSVAESRRSKRSPPTSSPPWTGSRSGTGEASWRTSSTSSGSSS